MKMKTYEKNERVKTDCFAFSELVNGDCQCIALVDMQCANGKSCSFYKTREQNEAEKAATKKKYSKYY